MRANTTSSTRTIFQFLMFVGIALPRHPFHFMSDPLCLNPGNVIGLKFENHTRNQCRTRNFIPFGEECCFGIITYREVFYALIKSN